MKINRIYVIYLFISRTFITCLQLDRIPLNNEYLRLPRDLLDCCATVATRSNMSKDLVSAMQRM
jgi:hypothetical protein